MGSVISFRPHPREERIIEETMRQEGFQTRSEAVRHLILKARQPRRDTLLEFRIPAEFQDGRSWSPAEIDDALYGGEP